MLKQSENDFSEISWAEKFRPAQVVDIRKLFFALALF